MVISCFRRAHSQTHARARLSHHISSLITLVSGSVRRVIFSRVVVSVSKGHALSRVGVVVGSSSPSEKIDTSLGLLSKYNGTDKERRDKSGHGGFR